MLQDGWCSPVRCGMPCGLLFITHELSPQELRGTCQVSATLTAEHIQDFSAMPRLSVGHHCQKTRKGKGTNTPGPAAQHRPCRRRLPAAASSWNGRHGGTMSVCQEVLSSLPPLLCASSGCPLTHPNPALGRATSPVSGPLAKARGSRM